MPTKPTEHVIESNWVKYNPDYTLLHDAADKFAKAGSKPIMGIAARWDDEADSPVIDVMIDGAFASLAVNEAGLGHEIANLLLAVVNQPLLSDEPLSQVIGSILRGILSAQREVKAQLEKLEKESQSNSGSGDGAAGHNAAETGREAPDLRPSADRKHTAAGDTEQEHVVPQATQLPDAD